MKIAQRMLVDAFASVTLSVAWTSAWAAQVVSIFPSSQAIDAHEFTILEIGYDAPLDPTTVTLQNLRIFGRWSGPASGLLSLQDGNTRIRFTALEPFFAGEMVTVVASKGLLGLDGQPIHDGYSWQFWIRTHPGELAQEEIDRLPVRRTGEGHIQCYGAYAGDLDDDGWTDLTVINEIPSDVRVLLHDGSTGFGPPALPLPLQDGDTPSPSEGADFDKDGHIDIVVGNTRASTVNILFGNGQGGFSRQSAVVAGEGIRGVGVIDLDHDGDDDLLVAGREMDQMATLLNLGGGAFGPPTGLETGGEEETAVAIGDANADGILDVFVGAHLSSEIVVYLGDGHGGLHKTAQVPSGGRCWMIAAGDVDGDGTADVVSANSWSNNVSVLKSDGTGGFAPADTYPAGDFPLAIDLGDLDGDGDLDLVSSNFNGGTWSVFENDGDGNFTLADSPSASTAGSCAILHDRDHDGDLDITGIDEIDDLVFLFDNPGDLTAANPSVPTRVQVGPNSPNPFNPSTTFPVILAEDAHVLIEVLNLRGERVRVLLDGFRAAGPYTVTWDGRTELGEDAPSGTYLYRVQALETSVSQKMTLVR